MDEVTKLTIVVYSDASHANLPDGSSLALSDALDDALYLREVIAELLGEKLAIIAYIDNKNLHSLIHSTTAITEKRLRIEVAAIKEMMARNEVSHVHRIQLRTR